MIRGLKALLEDLGGYVPLVGKKLLAPFEGRGVDYATTDLAARGRQVVEQLHPTRMRLEVVEVRQETDSTTTFRLVRRDGPLPPFRAGQYVNLFVTVAGVRTSRPYSISSPPGEAHLELTVRDTPGGFVAPHLRTHLVKGDMVETTGPAGSFYHEPLIDGDELLFIAGGSGITPFMAMLRDQARRGWPLDVHLLYGSRTPTDVIFGEELSAMASATERLRYDLVVSDPPPGYGGATGLFDEALLGSLVDDVTTKTVYVCGPTAMYDLVADALARLGVPRHRVRRELYGPPADVTKSPGWPPEVDTSATVQVEVAGHGTIPARPTEPLIAALERHGIVVPAVCRSGECSACRTKVVRGQVYQPPHTGLREADRATGHVHACVTYPLGDIAIELG